MNGVVFDFDGVLADSEDISGKAWLDVLADNGIAAANSDIEACIGLSSAATYEYFARMGPLPPYLEVLDAVDERRQSRYPGELRGFPDAIEAAKTLAMMGIPMAIASSSSRVNLDLKLEVLDLARYFDTTVAGDEVPKAKPAPDLYAVAVERIGIEPATSIAVEDTVIGADAASAAGLRTVIVDRMGLPTGSHPVVSEVDADLLLLWLGRM